MAARHMMAERTSGELVALLLFMVTFCEVVGINVVVEGQTSSCLYGMLIIGLGCCFLSTPGIGACARA